jgi:hypothetical protein
MAARDHGDGCLIVGLDGDTPEVFDGFLRFVSGFLFRIRSREARRRRIGISRPWLE